MDIEMLRAKQELGDECFYEHFRTVFGIPCLDFVETIVINLPESFVIWNTNGINVDENYLDGISKINCINLHRNSLDERENKKIFKSAKEIISLEKAKILMGEKLFLRITVDENFDIDEFIKLGIPLYLNRLLPGTKETNKNFKRTMQKLSVSNVERKRRNVYIDSVYSNVPVLICLDDKLSSCVPNRKPTFLNVAIIHRSGIVCGSWYENDKVIFNPNNVLDITVQNIADDSVKTLGKTRYGK